MKLEELLQIISIDYKIIITDNLENVIDIINTYEARRMFMHYKQNLLDREVLRIDIAYSDTYKVMVY